MTNNTKYQKKIKNIQQMMIVWADHQVDDKKKDLPDNWKPNFKWLLQKENAKTLTKTDMVKCNELHEHYGDPKGIMRNLK